jgi:hypothetical protein
MTMRKAEDKSAMRAILARLYAVNSYFAYGDFKAANPKGRRYTKKGEPLPYNPYSLSPLTLEAREHYTLAQRVVWTDETENKIKSYLMRLRLSGELDKILEWEKTSGNRYERNPWRDKEGAEE